MADQVVLTWNDVVKNIRQRLAQTDARLRRAKGDEYLSLQGRAQALEELLNLPETLKVSEQEEKKSNA